jgi:hypothetical protein
MVEGGCVDSLRQYVSNAGMGDLNFGCFEMDLNELLSHIVIVQKDNKKEIQREGKRQYTSGVAGYRHDKTRED